MKRAVLILLSLILTISLFGCSELTQETAEPTPAPTPNPLEAYSGQWTWESGDGSIVWKLFDDGAFLVPQQTYDGYRSIAGLGTWDIEQDGLRMTLADEFSMQIVEEDGFVKLYCPLLNQTLVRCEEREAAYAAKFVDVQLTDENIWDYFRLDQVPAPVDENGERIYKEVFVMRNAQYENGLIYWTDEDVRLDLVYWWSYRLHADGAPYGVAFYVKNFNSAAAEGQITFIRSDHVAEYNYDGNVRTVVMNSGEVLTERFKNFRYGNYPY